MYFIWILDLSGEAIMVHRGCRRCIKQAIRACALQSSLNRPVPAPLLDHNDSGWNLHHSNLHHKQLWATMETHFQTSRLSYRQQPWQWRLSTARWVIYVRVLPPVRWTKYWLFISPGSGQQGAGNFVRFWSADRLNPAWCVRTWQGHAYAHTHTRTLNPSYEALLICYYLSSDVHT